MNRIVDFFKDDFFAFERTQHMKYEESKFISPNKTFFTCMNLFMDRDPYKRKDDPHLRNNFVIHKVYGDFDNYYEKLYDANYFINSDNNVDSYIIANEFEDDENLMGGRYVVILDTSWDYCRSYDGEYRFDEMVGL